MFCPQCGSTQSDELRFCKSCGINLGAVREVVQTGHAPKKRDSTKTWIEEILLSTGEAARKEHELELLTGATPDIRRRNEIKAGVITSSVGIALMVFLRFLMEGIILGGNIPPGDAEILSRVWLSGIIPFMVGLSLIINGVYVSKLFSKNNSEAGSARMTELPGKPSTEYLPPADTSELFPAGFSVTDETTAHLKVPRQEK